MTQAGVALAGCRCCRPGGRWRCRRVVVGVVASLVVAEDDDLGEGRSEGAGDPGVELVRDDAADVVGLHDVGEGDRSHGWRAYGSSLARTGCGLVEGAPSPAANGPASMGAWPTGGVLLACGGAPPPAIQRRRLCRTVAGVTRLWRAALPGRKPPALMTRSSTGAGVRGLGRSSLPARRPSRVDGRFAQRRVCASWRGPPSPGRLTSCISGPSPTGGYVRATLAGQPARGRQRSVSMTLRPQARCTAGVVHKFGPWLSVGSGAA